MKKNRLYLLFSSSVFLFIVDCYSQNIGINNTNPTRAKLEVNGMVGNTAAIFGSDGTGIGIIASSPEIGFNAFYNGGTRYVHDGYAAVQFLGHTLGYIGFDVHGSGFRDAPVSFNRRAMTIVNNGRVGIGPSPAFNATLDVSNHPGFNSTAYFAAQDNFSAFNYSSSEYTAIRGVASSGAHSDISFNHFAPNSKISLCGGSGYVGINWSAPVYPMEVHAPGGGGFEMSLMREGSNNNWSLGTSQGYLKLYFCDVSSVTQFVRNQKGSFDPTHGTYSASSDFRIKKNIESLPNMLKKIMQLKPRKYEMIKNNPGHDQTFGLIAQEVKEIFPELVHVSQATNTGYKNISDLHMLNYSGLASPIVKALQEQQLMLNELENKLQKMEFQMRELHTNKNKLQ
jgi:hypothetical protein